MGRVVVLTGGGIKGAVAAARYAPEHELVLLYFDYGQAGSPAEARAVASLAAAFPAARPIRLSLPHVKQLQAEPNGAGRTERAVGSVPDTGTLAPGAVPLSSSAALRRATTRADDPPVAPVLHGPRTLNSPALSPALLRGLLPVLVSSGLQAAMRFGASTVVMGLSRFCPSMHLGFGSMGGKADSLHEFAHAFNNVIRSLPLQGSPIHVEIPVIDVNYAQILKLAQRFSVPLERTWTCEQPGPLPCGRCEACQARAAAFTEAALVDPLTNAVPG